MVRHVFSLLRQLRISNGMRIPIFNRVYRYKWELPVSETVLGWRIG